MTFHALFVGIKTTLQRFRIGHPVFWLVCCIIYFVVIGLPCVDDTSYVIGNTRVNFSEWLLGSD